jgi:hypothetical protein
MNAPRDLSYSSFVPELDAQHQVRGINARLLWIRCRSDGALAANSLSSPAADE